MPCLNQLLPRMNYHVQGSTHCSNDTGKAHPKRATKARVGGEEVEVELCSSLNLSAR